MGDFGIIFGLIAMLSYGFGNSLSPIAIKRIGSIRTIFFRNLFTSAILLIIFFSYPFRYEFSLKFALIAIAVSIIGFFPLWTFYKAQKRGRIGIINPISNSSFLFTVLFSVVFFGENLNLYQLLAIIIILLGIIFSSVNFKDFKKSEILSAAHGVPYAIITMVLWGLVFALFKIPVNVLGPILTSFFIEFGILAVCGVWLLRSSERFRFPDSKSLKILFIIAVLGVTGLLFYNMGICAVDVSIVSALTFSNPFISILFGHFYFRDRLRKLQYLSVILLIAGIIMMSYFS